MQGITKLLKLLRWMFSWFGTMPKLSILQRKLHAVERDLKRSGGRPVVYADETPVSMLPPLTKNRTASMDAGKARSKRKPPGLKPLTFAEKAKLREDLLQIPGEFSATLVDIVHAEKKASLEDGTVEYEIEIDIDKLDTKVLKKLQQFAKSVLTKPKPRRQTADKTIPAPSQHSPDHHTQEIVPHQSADENDTNSTSSGATISSDGEQRERTMAAPNLNSGVFIHPDEDDEDVDMDVEHTDAWTNF
eukprot:TRINITY_DN7080_c0_g2_i1.p1 TRINITY_DN7080_c0_g2~~TRINITY_DN7080_c0_g2_i1.p1  ORF type:complete len:246 (+),score=56.81 TRINITY_DN7080_c0_g2_i1:270-1007(+)